MEIFIFLFVGLIGMYIVYNCIKDIIGYIRNPDKIR